MAFAKPESQIRLRREARVAVIDICIFTLSMLEESLVISVQQKRAGRFIPRAEADYRGIKPGD
jgi:putative transcriptional regulator